MSLDPTFTVAALGAVEAAVNAALALDPDTLCRLEPLEGKVLALELELISFPLFLAPGREGVRVMGWFDGRPDATLRGSPGALMRWFSGGDAGEVELSGDQEFARAFREAFDPLGFDWEEQLSRIAGDLIAHEAGNLARGLASWGTAAGLFLRRSVSDYLQEEARLLPSRGEFETFAREAGALRADADRLEARLNRLLGRTHGG